VNESEVLQSYHPNIDTKISKENFKGLIKKYSNKNYVFERSHFSNTAYFRESFKEIKDIDVELARADVTLIYLRYDTKNNR